MNKTEKTFSFISVKDSFFKARYEVLDESTGDNHVITYENKAPVHPSLSEALQRMAYHVVNFTGLVAVDDNFQITGYQRQNCGDAQLLTIYARVGTSEEFCGNVVSRRITRCRHRESFRPLSRCCIVRPGRCCVGCRTPSIFSETGRKNTRIPRHTNRCNRANLFRP